MTGRNRRIAIAALIAGAALTGTMTAEDSSTGLTISPSALSFAAVLNGTVPGSQSLKVSAPVRTTFSASFATSSGGNWLRVSPTGTLATNQTLTVSVSTGSLAPGTYAGSVILATRVSRQSVPVTLVISSTPSRGPTSGFKLVGWNDLGMHCQDGKDYSIFAVLPPYNTIHAHLMDASGNLITTDIGYSVTYQSVVDPLTGTLNTTSSAKTNFWQYAAALGFGTLVPDTGLKGYQMPGAGNTPRKMTYDATDNTWTAVGIPILPYADAGSAPYPTNYFPMMRLVAKNALGTVLATTDITLPVSDEMNCATCHSSSSGYTAAKPASGWANNSDPAKDVKLNIVRKHDDRFAATPLFQSAATQVGLNPAGLGSAGKPILCAVCHGSNALGLAGVSGVQPLTTAVHGLHATAIDPTTGATLDSATSRDSCYRCHPGAKTQCLRGAMGNLKTSSGGNLIECQSCHGSLSNVAVATRSGWLDEPACQSCHTGTATSNSGQIVYTSVFSSGTIVRMAKDATFATNANTPAAGLSLYRFSKGHGGLQCEACHGSTHAEYVSSIVNDNVQSVNLQGHAGTLAECTACHASVPSTVNGGPHGLHPVGPSWVSAHPDQAEHNGTASCQPCHGTDYRGTILSKTQADRTMAGKTFPRGTIIGCYSCHNGPSGG